MFEFIVLPFLPEILGLSFAAITSQLHVLHFPPLQDYTDHSHNTPVTSISPPIIPFPVFPRSSRDSHALFPPCPAPHRHFPLPRLDM